ncbi:cAMP-responsive element modulator-like isoform X2 [Tubulanus polymorphus]|uniref:cAMP-responsive element modulator-like isoform X2 n=1 Tax=Tubulanus polymorphus TaxID=672921 RepID=UPI003DA54E80
MDLEHDLSSDTELDDNVIVSAPPQISIVHIPNNNSINQSVSPGSSEDCEDQEGRKRHELLSRRPSYRKILNELSSDNPPVTVVQLAKVEEESLSPHSQDSVEGNDAANSLQSSSAVTSFQQATVIPAHTIQIAAQDANTQGLQTLTMTNAGAAGTTGGATIVQYAQGPDGQFFIPVTLAGNVQAYQISTPTSLPQSVVMAASGATLTGTSAQISEEAARKRELRLLKNREAARECRRKKKDYVKCLENRVAVLENQNKALIEELKSLKELYCQKEHQVA